MKATVTYQNHLWITRRANCTSLSSEKRNTVRVWQSKFEPQKPDWRALITNKGPRSVKPLKMRALIFEGRWRISGQSCQEMSQDPQNRFWHINEDASKVLHSHSVSFALHFWLILHCFNCMSTNHTVKARNWVQDKTNSVQVNWVECLKPANILC